MTTSELTLELTSTPVGLGTVLDSTSLWDILTELYDARSKWKMIALGLRLQPSDLETMSGDALVCLENSLSKWLKGIDPLPTWGALVAVLKSPLVGEEKKGQELEKRFCAANLMSPASSSPVQAVVTLEETPSVGNAASITNANSSYAMCTPSTLSYIERINDTEVKSKVKLKNNQFRTLVRKAHRHLSNTIKTPEEFADFRVAITLMPASLLGHHILLSPDDRTAIVKAKTLDQIFVVLNQYWSFHQYELLEYVVQEYGSAGLKEEMKAYASEMDAFEAQVGVDHFTLVRFCSPRPDSAAVEVHLSGSHHMLRNARLVQQSMAEQCGLHPHAVRTFQSTPGSTVLTLLVPYAVAGHVVAAFRGMPLAQDLLSRPLDERVVIYRMDEAETEMHLPLHTNALVEASVGSSGRRERSGSDVSSLTASTGYETLSKASEGKSGVVVEPSQIPTEIEEGFEKLFKQPAALERTVVCILGSVTEGSNESMIPQLPATLSSSDCQTLSELCLPPEWNMNTLNVLQAMYSRVENCDVLSLVSTPKAEVSRNIFLQQIKLLFTTSENGTRAIIHYFGNGKRNTGDWCFKDGFIAFTDIAGLYMEHGLGRDLTIVSDCHSSGHWVSECAKFLDEQGVKPCGHSAVEKGIQLKLLAACETGQDTAELCYCTRAMEIKGNRRISYSSRKRLRDNQRTLAVDFTKIKCGGEGRMCSISSDSTWSTDKEVTSGRILRVHGHEHFNPAWHYVLLDDDVDKMRDYMRLTQGENAGKHSVDIRDYGTVLKSGWGLCPPQDIEERIIKTYIAEYMDIILV